MIACALPFLRMSMNGPRRFAALLVLLPALSAVAGDVYRVDVIGDREFTGRALNEAGAVLAANYQSTWLYQNGVLQDLGSFGSSSSWVVAHDLNDSGVIVGGRASSSGSDEAFIADHGIITVIPGMRSRCT